MVVKDRGKTFRLKSDIFEPRFQSFRIDVMNTMDLPMASIVLTPKEIQYFVVREKTFYKGKPGPRALDHVFPLAVDSTILSSILSERPRAQDKCTKLDEGLKCEGVSGSTKFSVQYLKRKNFGPMSSRASLIALDFPDRQVELKFFFTNIEALTEDKMEVMTLPVPAGYKTVPLSNN